MKRQSLPTSLAALLLLCFFARADDAAEINGVPECAKECALEYLASHPDCPLVTQDCICGYLEYYDDCVAAECNSTDFAEAHSDPIPYYVAEGTISIVETTTACPLSNRPTFTSEPETAKPTGTEVTTTTEGESSETATSEVETTGAETTGPEETTTVEKTSAETASASVTEETTTSEREMTGTAITESETGSESTTAPEGATQTATETSTAPVETFTGAASMLISSSWGWSLYAGLMYPFVF